MGSLEAEAQHGCSQSSYVISYLSVCKLCVVVVTGHHLVIEHLVAEFLDTRLHHHLEICDRSSDPVHNFRNIAGFDLIDIPLHVCHLSGLQFLIFIVAHLLEIDVLILL